MSDEHVMDLVVVELVLFLVENLVVAEDRVVDIVQEFKIRYKIQLLYLLFLKFIVQYIKCYHRFSDLSVEEKVQYTLRIFLKKCFKEK